ncbi:MAG: TIGR02281 family clan AA aspartic protease [Methylophilaceae bacterium]
MFKLKSVLFFASLCAVMLVILLSGKSADPFIESLPVSSGNGVDTPVVLYADEEGHFFGNLSINGVSLKYIVDSGASNVTLNSNDAKQANIDYTKGERVSLVTPGGEVQAFSLMLNGLMIGTAVLNNVETTIVEGDSPPYVLLGISAQKKLDVKRDNAIMTLGRKHKLQ